MEDPYQLYYREENDFVFYVNAMSSNTDHYVVVVVTYKPTGNHCMTTFTREEWDDYGYDARQGIWATLAYRAKHE